jgi:ribosomal protein S18 acetylase RimI-like enzyme
LNEVLAERKYTAAMQVEFRRAIVPREIRRLKAFDKKVFPKADLFDATAWRGYESYWMIVDRRAVGCCAFQTNVDFQEDVREDGVNTPLPGSLYIATTGILPGRQGTGLGALLKCWEIAYAKYHGYKRVVTNVRSRNAAMLALNRKFGFQEIRTTAGYYAGPRDATVVMELVL